MGDKIGCLNNVSVARVMPTIAKEKCVCFSATVSVFPSDQIIENDNRLNYNYDMYGSEFSQTDLAFVGLHQSQKLSFGFWDVYSVLCSGPFYQGLISFAVSSADGALESVVVVVEALHKS